MQPFIGNKYGKDDVKKVLLIAESHYLPEGSSVLPSSEWYENDESHLTTEERHYIDTREVTKIALEKGNKKSIFYKLSEALKPINPNQENHGFDYAAYMNCFQKPAPYGTTVKDSLDKSGLDTKVAKEVVSAVVNAINPDVVIFTSKLAWDYVGKYVQEDHASTKFDFTYHPTGPFTNWNGEMGLQRFQDIITSI
jgi:DNA-directed RNA polymerase subunit F